MKTKREIIKEEVEKLIKFSINDITENFETMYVSSAIIACTNCINSVERWIPIEEELPKIRSFIYEVLVFNENDRLFNVFDIEIDYNEKSLKEDFILNDITHWRPITIE